MQNVCAFLSFEYIIEYQIYIYSNERKAHKFCISLMLSHLVIWKIPPKVSVFSHVVTWYRSYRSSHSPRAHFSKGSRKHIFSPYSMAISMPCRRFHKFLSSRFVSVLDLFTRASVVYNLECTSFFVISWSDSFRFSYVWSCFQRRYSIKN